MQIDKQGTEDVRILVIQGEIRTEDARVLGDSFQDALEEGDLDLIIDLSDVKYITSAALGHIVSTAAVLRRRGGNLAVCGLSSEVKKAFSVTRIDRVVEVQANQEAALEKLRHLVHDN